MTDAPDALEYVGFWPRVGASLIDTVLTVLVTGPLLYAIYGSAYFTSDNPDSIRGVADVLVSWVLPAVAIIVFWVVKRATPGKMAIGAVVVDATTGEALSTGQAIGRYLGYFISTIPLGLGLFWVAFDRRKQGWHDKIANTVVVRSRSGGVQPVTFHPH